VTELTPSGILHLLSVGVERHEVLEDDVVSEDLEFDDDDEICSGGAPSPRYLTFDELWCPLKADIPNAVCLLERI
jgi:hypothetical protein